VTKLLLIGALFLVLVAVLIAGCKATRAGYETAPYQVVRGEGRFEIRVYSPLFLAQTPMTGGKPDSGNSFGRLFKYISGANDTGQKIAMTTPVIIEPGGSNSAMAFVVPRKYGSNEVPQPRDPLVKVKEFSGGRYAVYRFSGGDNPENRLRASEQLSEWLRRQKLECAPDFFFAFYDPPWTPGFLRRNEVLARVLPQSAS
jgi:hypothetical protein